MERLGKKKKSKNQKQGFAIGKSDPLYQIFEKHLYEFNYEGRDSFINTVVEEYLELIVKNKLVIPMNRQAIMQDTLQEEVSDMLIRRIYGCLQIEDDIRESSERALLHMEKQESNSSSGIVKNKTENKKRQSKNIR